VLQAEAGQLLLSWQGQQQQGAGANSRTAHWWHCRIAMGNMGHAAPFGKGMKWPVCHRNVDCYLWKLAMYDAYVKVSKRVAPAV
jgi:hypothetical protein